MNGTKDTGLVPKRRHFGIQFLVMGGACSVGCGNDRRKIKRKDTDNPVSVQKENELGTETTAIRLKKTEKERMIIKERYNK
jgi:hypothetical protein